MKKIKFKIKNDKTTLIQNGVTDFMVKIPKEIQEFVNEQGVFVVGTTGSSNLTNVSPRIFFKIKEDAIFWIDFFQHKSYKNFKSNPWVTVAVFNKDNLKGYQFRGTVTFVTDEPTRTEMTNLIKKETEKRNPSDKVKKLSKQQGELIQFEVKVCYSLNPEEYSDMSIGSDINSKQIFQ